MKIRKLAVLLTAAALTAAAATGCTGGKETEAVAAGAGTGTETGTTAFPFFSQLLMILQTSPNTYRSNLHIFPFRSNSGMKSEGYMIPLFGCFQRTRASAPSKTRLSRPTFGWRYTWKSWFSMEPANRLFNSSALSFPLPHK